MTFDKKDYNYLLNRENVRSFLVDFLSKDYYRRKDLIDKGYIGVAYTYRVHFSDGDKHHRSFALFTPNLKLMIDENFYLGVLKNIDDLRQKTNKSFKEKKFLNYVDGIETKPQYYQLDHNLTDGKRVYLQYIEVIPQLNPNLKLGMNYVLYAPLITKEIRYVAEKYITE